MSVVSKFRNFLWRNKNKFIYGGVLITGSILLTKYAQQRLKEWQEKETVEFFEKSRKYNHFESIGQTCNQTISNLSVALLDVINVAVNTDALINSLRMNTENKLEIWNALKVMVFTKAALIIYSIVMLVITLRIQLSIIGGYLYKDPNAIPAVMQEKYLSLCQNFLNNGITKLSNIMEAEVKKYVDHLELNKQLKLSDIEAIYWSIQTALATHDESPVEHFRNYMLPDIKINSTDSSDVYNDILRDTADFLDSDEIKSVTTHCINRGFILLGDQIAEFYNQNGATSSKSVSDNTFENPFELKKPLAKFIPILNGLLSTQSLPQHFIQQLAMNDKLQTLSANIYESLL